MCIYPPRNWILDYSRGTNPRGTHTVPDPPSSTSTQYCRNSSIWFERMNSYPVDIAELQSHSLVTLKYRVLFAPKTFSYLKSESKRLPETIYARRNTDAVPCNCNFGSSCRWPALAHENFVTVEGTLLVFEPPAQHLKAFVNSEWPACAIPSFCFSSSSSTSVSSSCSPFCSP